MQEHSVRSLDAIARLESVMVIATEWIDRLGTDRANFEEFLAKTRTLVCGTCVGLGRAHLRVAKTATTGSSLTKQQEQPRAN